MPLSVLGKTKQGRKGPCGGHSSRLQLVPVADIIYLSGYLMLVALHLDITLSLAYKPADSPPPVSTFLIIL